MSSRVFVILFHGRRVEDDRLPRTNQRNKPKFYSERMLILKYNEITIAPKHHGLHHYHTSSVNKKQKLYFCLACKFYLDTVALSISPIHQFLT